MVSLKKNCFRDEIQATSGAAMYLGGILALLLVTLHDSHGSVQRVPAVQCDDKDIIQDSIYNYTLPDLFGVQNISLSDYKGKVRNDVCTRYTILDEHATLLCPLLVCLMPEKFLH
jgi:hypothetical protein